MFFENLYKKSKNIGTFLQKSPDLAFVYCNYVAKSRRFFVVTYR